VSARVEGGATAATRLLAQQGVAYTAHSYAYEEHGGTAQVALLFDVPEHMVVKSLVFEDQDGQPLMVLMHGDRKVSAKALARQIGCKSVAPCKPELAQRHSGYLVGGTSPFGCRKAMPLYVERSILALPRIYINGGRRGLQVGLAPQVLVALLAATPVDAALEK
jgi:Cys-tRNA(Pro) deacylase